MLALDRLGSISPFRWKLTADRLPLLTGHTFFFTAACFVRYCSEDRPRLPPRHETRTAPHSSQSAKSRQHRGHDAGARSAAAQRVWLFCGNRQKETWPRPDVLLRWRRQALPDRDAPRPLTWPKPRSTSPLRLHDLKVSQSRNCGKNGGVFIRRRRRDASAATSLCAGSLRGCRKTHSAACPRPFFAGCRVQMWGTCRQRSGDSHVRHSNPERGSCANGAASRIRSSYWLTALNGVAGATGPCRSSHARSPGSLVGSAILRPHARSILWLKH